MKVATVQRVLWVVLAGLLTAIAVVLLSGLGGRGTDGAGAARGASAFDGPLLPPHVRAADFTLTDERGRRTTMAQFRGRVVVLTFVHSQCTGACPLMVQQIKGALDDLPHAGAGVAALAVSVEPAQDTRRNRRAFLRKVRMVGRMRYLNGPAAVVHRVWREYAIRPVLNEHADDHSAFVLLIDRRGIERIGYPVSDLTPESLAHDLAALGRERR